MHEQSLIRTLLGHVEQIRRQNAAARVTEVRVEIGPLSGVEPLLLSSAFLQLAPDSTAAGAELVIDEVPLSARCQDCGCEFEVCDLVFRCPACQGNIRVIRGDGFQLVSVSLSGTQTELPERNDSAVGECPMASPLAAERREPHEYNRRG